MKWILVTKYNYTTLWTFQIANVHLTHARQACILSRLYKLRGTCSYASLGTFSSRQMCDIIAIGNPQGLWDPSLLFMQDHQQNSQSLPVIWSLHNCHFPHFYCCFTFIWDNVIEVKLIIIVRFSVLDGCLWGDPGQELSC